MRADGQLFGARALLWLLKAASIMFFALASYWKLTGAQPMVTEFAKLGWGQWFRYFTGVSEIIAIVLVLVPGISVFGTAMMLAIDVGAGIACATVLNEDWLHTLPVALVLLVMIVMERSQIRSVLNRLMPVAQS